MTAVIELGLIGDTARFEQLLTLSPERSLDGLRGELAQFTLPYRDDFLRAWTSQRDSLAPGTTAEIPNLESLWNGFTDNS